MTDERIFDITIVGGGPTGLFGAFYAGMRELSTKIMDSLEELGGQLVTLYPEKYIYDMPGFPRVLAKDLAAAMAEQALQYGPTLCLGQKVTELTRRSDGVWVLGTERGERHLSRTVLITAGAGGFAPRPLPLPEVERFVGKGVHYFVRDKSRFAGRRLLIVGGGDSAVDWALALHPIARECTLIHRRDRFRAHESSVRQLLASPVRVRLFWEVAAIHGDDAVEAVTLFHNQTQERETMPVDDIILSLGFHADLGPIKTWGLAMQGGAIVVNSRMETNLPGVYAAGDVCTYDGKLKLIATGVGEAAIAVNHAKVYVDPSARAFPGHSSDIGAPVAASNPSA